MYKAQDATMGGSSGAVGKARELESLIYSVLSDLLAIVYEKKKKEHLFWDMFKIKT